MLELNAITGKTFRLPTKEEWELARGAGNANPPYRYCGSNDRDEVAWYDENSGEETHPVGKKDPTLLGIYDMSGNVGELTADVEWSDFTHTPLYNYCGGSFYSDWFKLLYKREY